VFDGDDGTTGRELWVTDGSTAGTTLLKDINPGPGDSSPRDFAALARKAKYIVRSGDTLSAVAARFRVTLAALVGANAQIADPDRIFPGQVITIPGSSPAPGPEYVVQSGDTLNAIAKRFGVGLAALEAANPQIADPNRIFPGR
jgi:tyrosinase